MGRFILSALAIFVGCFVLVYFLGQKFKDKADMLKFCENTTKNILKDPASYKRDDFRIKISDQLPIGANERLYSQRYDPKNKVYPSVQIKYRAKNSFGAYIRGVAFCDFLAAKDGEGISGSISPVSVTIGGIVIENGYRNKEYLTEWIRYADSTTSVKSRAMSPLLGFYYAVINKEGMIN